MFMRAIATAAAVTAMAATGAAAATISFNTEQNNPQAGAIDFTNGSETVYASATRVDDNGNFVAGTALIASYMTGGGGLGVCSTTTDFRNRCSGDNWEVDGQGSNEMVLLDFGSTVVRLLSITFSNHQNNDDFAFLFATGGFFASSVDIADSNDSVRTFTFANPFEGSLFGIGAIGEDDDFKIRSIQYEVLPPVVPLPAAGVLLVAGLAGLGMLRRRKA